MGLTLYDDPALRRAHAFKLVPWLRQLGIKADPAVVMGRLWKKFKGQRIKFRPNGDVISTRGETLLHRDDVRDFLFGRELHVIAVPTAVEDVPPIEIAVPKIESVVEYEELEDGSFRCLAKGCTQKPYKRESAVQKHIREKH